MRTEVVDTTGAAPVPDVAAQAATSQGDRRSSVRKPQDRGASRRVPWALLATDLLVLHLAALSLASWWIGVLAALLLLVPANLAWARRLRKGPEAASRLAIGMWAVASLLGCAWVWGFRASLRDPPLVGIAAYGAAAFALVALVERGWPRSGLARAMWVAGALGVAYGAHVGLTLPGLGCDG